MKISNAPGKILLNNIITSGMKNYGVDIMRKVKMINTMSIIAILIIVPFGLVDLIKGYYAIGIFVYVIAAVLIFNLLYLRKSGNYLFPIYCGTSIVAFYYIYALVTGGVNNTGYLWFFTFPLFVMFLLGSKKGAAAALLLLIPPIVFFSIRLDSSIFTAYSMDFKIRFILSYLVVVLFAYLFETLKEKVQRTLSTINDELQDTIADLQVTEEKLRKSGEELEQKVMERTDELANTLNRLKRELKHRKQAQEKIKASLKEKEVLLKEIHHRVKNNLQVISSLLSLQSQHITDKASRAMFEESQSRVRAMALIHEKLYQSDDLAHIDIAAYMQDLTASLFSTYTVRNKIKVDIAITDIFLTITTAIPCGLIINELVTNALKHAFPKERDGTITVSMTPSNTDSLILTVSDTGIGFPEGIDFRNITTLGMQLVTSLVEQLDGTITLDRSEGTTFTITFRG